MLAGVFILIQYIFDRLLGPSTRADALYCVRLRLSGQDGPSAASPEEVQSAMKLRVLRKKITATLGFVESCSRCAKTESPIRSGGHCCGGCTEDLFTDDESAALALSGTRPSHLKPPGTGVGGCVFRGPLSCSIAPDHRPSLCARYMCFELLREIDQRGDGFEIDRLQEELRAEFDHFVYLRKARLDAQLLEEMKAGLLVGR
jgi:hypothetical protein